MLQTEPVLSGMTDRRPGGHHSFRHLKRLGLLAVAAVVLAACGTPDPSFMNTRYDAKAFPANGKAIVIAASVAETKGGLLRGFKPVRHISVETIWLNISPEAVAAGKNAPNKFRIGFANPQVQMVDPGRYIMTSYRSNPVGNTIYTGRGITLDPKLGQMVVPSFRVDAGEVIYVGSQLFRFTVPGRRFEIIDDQEALAEDVTDDPRYTAIRDEIETRLITIGVLPRNTPGVDS